jgi:hypothetical protein
VFTRKRKRCFQRAQHASCHLSLLGMLVSPQFLDDALQISDMLFCLDDVPLRLDKASSSDRSFNPTSSTITDPIRA